MPSPNPIPMPSLMGEDVDDESLTRDSDDEVGVADDVLVVLAADVIVAEVEEVAVELIVDVTLLVVLIVFASVRLK